VTPEELRVLADPAEAAMVHSVGGAPAVIGTVIHGDQRGRELGFPTANLALASDDRIEDGVWAADVYVGNVRHIAAASIGRRPTFYAAGGVRLLEPFLLDFDGDLYGRTIVVHLRERIRPQRRFASAVALIQQMRRDVEDVRRWAQTARSRPLRARAALPAGAASRSPQRHGARDAQRRRLIEAAVQQELAAGAVISHERIAAVSGVPVGYLRWLLPSIDDLRAVAREVTVPYPR
tara:strand:+ start:9268 stop:9972 length:705 start_codon:yes stop_codon:yes gene_type:complete